MNVDFPYLLIFKAFLVINLAEAGLLALIEYKINKYFYPPMFLLEKWVFLSIIGLPPLVLNYYIFEYQNNTKRIINHFEKIDKKEKRNLNIQLLVLVLFLIGLVVLLFSV